MSVTSPMSLLILQPIRRFTYVTAFSNPSVSLPKSQITLQPFRCFTYVTAFSNPSVALPTSQLILQPFRCFTYVTAFSNPSVASPTSKVIPPTLLSLLVRHRLFTYITWRSAHGHTYGLQRNTISLAPCAVLNLSALLTVILLGRVLFPLIHLHPQHPGICYLPSILFYIPINLACNYTSSILRITGFLSIFLHG